ncbi:MAG: carbohydrate-binding domain-containing protein [Dysgonamonadaceae bacterium]|nr:carbohydrate-binding domain-containing protein [Dysgonamonadaceae bacterium]
MKTNIPHWTKAIFLSLLLFFCSFVASAEQYNIQDMDVTIHTSGEHTIFGNGNETTHSIKVLSSVTATITLKSVNINLSHTGGDPIDISDSGTPLDVTDGKCAFEIMPDATVHLILEENNTLKSGMHRAGLQVPEGATLDINGNGSLIAVGATTYGAGIGGGRLSGNGAITINGGTITATGGLEAAGIGSCNSYSSGAIIINGGTITATGGILAVGIGGGGMAPAGTIVINSGMVKGTIGTGFGHSEMINSLIIKGGNVAGPIYPNDLRPQNGNGQAVYRTEINFSPALNIPVEFAQINNSTYPINSMTDNGKVYVWLPEGNYSAKQIVLTTQQNSYMNGQVVWVSPDDNASFTATYNGTDIRQVDASSVQVRLAKQLLSVDSPEAEQVTVYSLSGTLLSKLEKQAGKASFALASTNSVTGSAQALIVKGSSGWVKKLISNK